MFSVSHNQHAMIQIFRAAKLLPRMRDSPEIKLHRVRIDGNGNWPVLNQPLGHIRFVVADVYGACQLHFHLARVEVASFVIPFVRVIGFGFQTTEFFDNSKINIL